MVSQSSPRLSHPWYVPQSLTHQVVEYRISLTEGTYTLLKPTLYPGSNDLVRHKCAEVYSTSFGWAKAYPMTRKGEAHETLSLLFHRDGVPPTMVLDGSKEQCLGDF